MRFLLRSFLIKTTTLLCLVVTQVHYVKLLILILAIEKFKRKTFVLIQNESRISERIFRLISLFYHLMKISRRFIGILRQSMKIYLIIFIFFFMLVLSRDVFTIVLCLMLIILHTSLPVKKVKWSPEISHTYDIFLFCLCLRTYLFIKHLNGNIFLPST